MSFQLKAVLTVIFVLITVVVFAAISTLYPCAGIYCAADGTSFWTFDYSVVKAYNATL